MSLTDRRRMIHVGLLYSLDDGQRNATTRRDAGRKRNENERAIKITK